MELLGLDWHAWFTVFAILLSFGLMLKTKIPTDIVFVGTIALLLLSGTLSTEDALSGFSSTSVAVVGVLFFVIAALDATGVLQWVVKHLLGQPKSYSAAIMRLMLPVAALSAFLSNTTVVALFIKVVKIWAKRLGIAPSRLLIPLSYAAGMGGVCTVIGTPANLIVSGFYADETGTPMGFFATAVPGIFCLIVGMITIMVLHRFIPSRVCPEDELKLESNSATTELYVPTSSHLIGQTLSECHMLEGGDCQLVGIVRFDGEVVREIVEDEFIMGSDTLVFIGSHAGIIEKARLNGLETSPLDREPQSSGKTLLSAVIMLGMVLLSALKIMPLLHSCVLAAILVLVTRCCTVAQAKKAVNWDVLMIFAGSVALGKAVDSSGLAQTITGGMMSLCGSNVLLTLIIICFLGTFLTEFVSNTACGAILAPIAIQTAVSLGADPYAFCIALMVAVSSSFATPMGSPTHMLVYTPGGYKFTDFLRIGLPMNFIILAANIFIVWLVC